MCVALLLASAACREGESPSHAGTGVTDKKMIIIGFDGMDPKIVKRLMSEGKLPHFSKLSEEGGFKELATSVPPQSPVAWSNFITGMNPGGHGIFDFIHRDPESIFPY
ncbi:MAG: nucleotide pyrophosphatase, partial [Candidatus Dadabacteria bacterium]